MPKKKIDPEKLKTALAEGKTYAEAAKEAGSDATSPQALAAVTSQALRRDTKLRADVRDLLEEKRRMAIGAITAQKLKQATAAQLGVVIGVLTDKINILDGLPTQRLEGTIDFTSKDPADIKRWLVARLGSTKRK